MKFMKKNRPDVMIIILLILWGIYEIFVVPFEYDTLVSIFVGFNLVYLFPWCCKETSAEYLKIRMLPYNMLSHLSLQYFVL